MKLVVVESPAKAKTINKYLGSDFVVLSSFGHTHDLPSKNGSIIPEEDFKMMYQVSERSSKPLNDILKQSKKCDEIYLATDLDREGEAISWHIAEEIKSSSKEEKLIKRIVFNEITKTAILNALKNPRDIDMQLVNAQQARRALDYLMGFNLSPLLWRKIPSAKSAGRVQSVALRLICECEAQRESFVKQEYWSINSTLNSCLDEKNSISTSLFELDKKKLEKLSIADKSSADKILDEISKSEFVCKDISNKEYKRNPYAPFITSTLQQEAIKKLGFSASQTMKIAQELYEGIKIGDQQTGLITYMRTDSVAMSNDAIESVRSLISNDYGNDFLPSKANVYKKGANTQEAHECIHPSDFSLTPEKIKDYLTEKQFKLYNLIWIRTIASQMSPAKYSTTTVQFHSKDGNIGLKAVATSIVFLGFIKIYGRDSQDKVLDFKINVGDLFRVGESKSSQHFTEPQPRYSEASLVKQLEDLGIGRPSTYASIMDVIIKRNYAIFEDKKFVPTPTGRLVSAFLFKFFPRYVSNNFTALMEQELDNIAVGKIDWKESLKGFWSDFIANIDDVKKIDNQTISESITEEAANIVKSLGKKTCPKCDKSLDLKFSRFGIFLGCSGYPECKFTENINPSNDNKVIANNNLIGKDQDKEIYLCSGPYGNYIQLSDGKEKKNFSLPAKIDISSIDLNFAKFIISLPKEIGSDDDKKIFVGSNKNGFYLLKNKLYISINYETALNIDLDQAVDLFSKKSRPKKNKE